MTATRDPRLEPWPGRRRSRLAAGPLGGLSGRLLGGRRCNICGWQGRRFSSRAHCEFAHCPACGSIARDRFLYHCFVRRVGWRPGLSVLETSPRLGGEYQRRMAELTRYVTSDFDQSLHQGSIALDLQDADLPDESFDVILTPHVLEHVPRTDLAVRELFRITARGGTTLLQVPLLQPHTAPPTEPEYHEDNTLVHWRFGVDLTGRLREAGFVATMLVTEDLRDRVVRGDDRWSEVSPEFDAPGLVRAMRPDDLTVVAGATEARALGFEPSYMFVTWECVRPA